MRNCSKNTHVKKTPKTMRPNQILPLYSRVQQSSRQIKQTLNKRAQEISADPEKFFQQIVGFTPFEYQKEFTKLFVENQFVAARWCRQSGKSFIVCALLLWYATTHPGSAIGIVGPSWRQTKRVLERVGKFAQRLPPGTVFKPQKTHINFANGSTIEAFPNNPETIRGPTLNVVYCDEMNFIPNDQELYDAILYTLGATEGKFVCTSTPWNTDSVFFKIFNHENYRDFKTMHVTIDKALSPNGPLKPATIQKIKNQMGDDPSRWRREMQAEWIEDDDVWLPQSLIAQCVGTTQNCGADLKEYDPHAVYSGDFFAGLDLAQTKDYSVLAVVERLNDVLYLRHLKIFKQPTLYATVLSHIKVLQDRWGGFEKIRVDFTREGPSIIADMENAGIDNAEGVNFSVPRKSEMASLLKQRMANGKFFYPLLHWERPYRGEISTELNVERYELRKDGTIGYYHPTGTHDDVFWAIALAVYGTVEMEPEPFLAIVPR